MTQTLKRPTYLTLVGVALLLTLAWLIATQPLTWLAVAMAAVAAGLTLLHWPWLIWPLMGAALPWAAGVRFGPLSGLDLLLAVTVCLWLMDGAVRKTLRLDFIPVTVLALVYAGAQLVSGLNALDLGETGAEVVKWLEFAVVLLLMRQMTPSRCRQWLAAGILAGAMSQALLGLYQFIYQIGPDWFTILGRFMRASGSFRQPNPFAGYLGLSLPVALSLTLWGWGDLMRRLTSAHHRQSALQGIAATENAKSAEILSSLVGWAVFYTAAFGFITVGLLASWSRGGWLGAAASVIVVLVLFSRRLAMTAGVVALLLTGALLVGSISPQIVPAVVSARLGDLPGFFGLGNVLEQEVNDDNFAVIERVAHWVAAVRMWESAPWLGVGPGNYEAVYPSVRLPQWEEPLGHAHNIYLNVLGESGLVGTVAFLAFWGVTVAWLTRRRRAALAARDGWGGALAVGALGMLAYLAVHSIFDNLFVQGLYILIALWLGLVDLSTGATQGTMQHGL
jgi:O-antigen ligase